MVIQAIFVKMVSIKFFNFKIMYFVICLENICLINNGTCKNGGTCLKVGSNGYSCLCPLQFSGENCEIEQKSQTNTTTKRATHRTIKPTSVNVKRKTSTKPKSSLVFS
jgi:hypothetical protein